MKEEKEYKVSPLLSKMLERMSLTRSELPSSLDSWILFIKSINNLIYDFDQERYLLERSMELSSKEMRELYERFEVAQSIASIGYWYYDKTEERILWSRETYQIFGLDSANQPPSYDAIMSFVHEKDRDHLSILINKAFNQNLDYEMEFRIYRQPDDQLRWVYVKGHPEKLINEHTSQAKILLSGIIMDITTRKQSEQDLNRLNQKLVELSRLSGMSEIATSVLHNIGNVLNSVNVSASIMKKCVENSDIKKLIKINNLIHENIEKQPDFLVANEKGKLIPAYLEDLTKNLLIEFELITTEISNLQKNIDHIKSIVGMQKEISGISGEKERINLSDIVDVAVTIGCGSPEKYGIKITKKLDFTGTVNLNKSKLLQILINLFRNAKDALMEGANHTEKLIDIEINKIPNESYVEISVNDNGIGIQKENFNKIFSMGYTTKINGHGFGLHSSALAAKELGGSLTAESEGKDKGATFLLKLPIKETENERST